MNRLRKTIASMGRNYWPVVALAFGLLWAVGCESTSSGPTSNPSEGVRPGVDANTLSQFFRVGEMVKIEFYDITPATTFEQTIRDDGTITLALGQSFDAAGKSEAQLQDEIQKRYVPKFYKRLTVNFTRQNRYYFVLGEVKNPSQRPYTGDITVLKAIASAGGFTVFADKKKVQLIRTNGEKLIIDCVKAQRNPKLDPPVYPGDQVNVPLSWK